jgi:hypothetical protein
VAPAAGEELRSPAFQKDMGGIERDLKAQGINVSARVHFQKSADLGGAWFLGQFTIQAAQIAVPAIATVVGAYLVARTGRKVRLKTGKIEAEAHSVEELEKLLKLADDQQQKQP